MTVQLNPSREGALKENPLPMGKEPTRPSSSTKGYLSKKMLMQSNSQNNNPRQPIQTPNPIGVVTYCSELAVSGKNIEINSPSMDQVIIWKEYTSIQSH